MIYYEYYISVVYMYQWAPFIPVSDLKISTRLKKWLIDSGSTTKKLNALDLKVELDVVSQMVTNTSHVTINLPAFDAPDTLVRKSIIMVDNVLFMASNLYIQTTEQILTQILNDRDQLIGNILFSRKNVQRSDFKFCNELFSDHSSLTKIASSLFVSRQSCLTFPDLKCFIIESFHKDHPLFHEHFNG